MAGAIRSLLQALDQGFKFWAKIINGNNAYLVPTGMLGQFVQPPGGLWLVCNGGPVDPVKYPDLFALNGPTLPNIPNFYIHA